MGRVLTKVFDRLDTADRARDALVAAGFSHQQVAVTAREDEAGPVEGNFILDTKDGEGRPATSRATIVLDVIVENDGDARRVLEILQSFG